MDLFSTKTGAKAIAFAILFLALVMFFKVESAALQSHSNWSTVEEIKPTDFSLLNVIEVTTTADNVNAFDGVCSLREAIISANTNPEDFGIVGECTRGSETLTDRIILQNGVTYQMALTNGFNPEDEDTSVNDYDIFDNDAAVDLQIVSHGKGKAIIRGMGPAFAIPVGLEGFDVDRIFDIKGATVEFHNLEIRNGIAAHTRYGGAIQNDGGNVSLIDCLLTENRSPKGGAIYNKSGTMHLLRTEVTVNGNHFSATSDGLAIYGGGIFNGYGALLLLEESSISWNRIDFDHAVSPSGRTGGGIYNQGTITFVPGEEHTEIIHNKSYEGAALQNQGGIVQGSGFSIFGNTSTSEISSGIGLANLPYFHTGTPAGEIDLSDGFIGFHDNGTGFVNHGLANLANVNLASNGEAAISNSGTINLFQVSLHVNGVGLVSNGGTVVIEQSQIRDNVAIGQYGGGIQLLNGANATITKSSITANSALAAGGIYVFESSLLMANSTISGNETTLGVGGGMMIQGNAIDETVKFTNVTVHDNHTTSNIGSALYLLSRTIVPESANSIWSAPANESACASNTDNNPIETNGHNLASDETCFSSKDSSDQTGIDPQLATLANVEGTRGHALMNDSPAVDKANPRYCAKSPIYGEDQRGHLRDATCDIGALEFVLDFAPSN